MANRTAEGSLPSGKVIADRYGRHERWGRLVKRVGLAGDFIGDTRYDSHLSANHVEPAQERRVGDARSDAPEAGPRSSDNGLVSPTRPTNIIA
jgi:hypothetical protein